MVHSGGSSVEEKVKVKRVKEGGSENKGWPTRLKVK